MKTVIMAGGKGSRIASIFKDIPKPMIPIEGKPVLEYELECLRKQGFTDIIITVSHLGEVIVDYFGDGSKKSPHTGKPFGVKIEYYYEPTPLGTAGALFKIRDKLKVDFLLLNADSIFDVDLHRFKNFHEQKGGLVTIFTHPNSHPYDSGLIVTDEDDVVTKWLTKEDKRDGYYRNRVNAGLHIISPSILDIERKTEKVDLDRHLLKPLAGTRQMFAYDSPEYVSDMGTPDRYKSVCIDVRKGKVARRSLKHKQKAIFLDRDGTINGNVGFLRSREEFILLPNVASAIKAINNSEYLTIVITNQPVIARGEVSEAELQEIHNKMETLLGQDGAYVNGIYYCPHHPDRGFPGEKIEFKIDCGCRKPKPGLILQAAEDFNIDLSQSWMVGDSMNDIHAGLAAGCKTALITNNSDYKFGQTVTFQSLVAFTDWLFSH